MVAAHQRFAAAAAAAVGRCRLHAERGAGSSSNRPEHPPVRAKCSRGGGRGECTGWEDAGCKRAGAAAGGPEQPGSREGTTECSKKKA